MRHFNAVIVAVCLLISSCSVQSIRQPNPMAPTPIVVNQPVVDIKPQMLKIEPVAIPDVDPRELTCLSHGIYYEASNQGRRGMEAVGFVILNRSHSPNYPHDICAVVKQTNVFHGKRFCQFSWYCKNGETKLHLTPDNEAFKQSKQLASLILHKEIDNWMPHVVSFHLKGVRTKWTKHGRLTLFATIGSHVFYQEKS